MNDLSNINTFSDQAILKEIGQFIQQTRIRQNRTQEELSQAAAISRSTLSLAERGDNISLLNLIKILRTLDTLYVLEKFQLITAISPLQLAKAEKQKRQRASSTNKNNNQENLGW